MGESERKLIDQYQYKMKLIYQAMEVKPESQNVLEFVDKYHKLLTELLIKNFDSCLGKVGTIN